MVTVVKTETFGRTTESSKQTETMDWGGLRTPESDYGLSILFQIVGAIQHTLFS
jgi:hypothetical protein